MTNAQLAATVAWAVASVLPVAWAQQPVTSTAEQAGAPRRLDNYTVSNSIEMGYRFAQPDGDLDLYRASVNYGNGMRLFQGTLRVHSVDGKGRFVDELAVRSSGAVSDPYQAHHFRVAKNGLYRYDGQVRFMRYHNRLASLWLGEHGLRTDRALHAHDVVLRPESRFKVLIGFERNRRTGPGFGSGGVEEPFEGFEEGSFLRYRSDLRQANNQYRAGIEARFWGLALSARQAINRYEEFDEASDASRWPTLASNVYPVETMRLSIPIRRSTPVTTLAVRTDSEGAVGFVARYVYAGGQRNAMLAEELAVRAPGALAADQRETAVIGDVNQRLSSGEMMVVATPTPRWTVTNTTAFHNTRMDGRSSIVEIGFEREEVLNFEHLGVRRLSNTSEANFRPTRQVSLYGAYRASSRQVTSSEVTRFPWAEFSEELTSIDNSIRSGSTGLRLLPGYGIRASLDFEIGRADRPLTPLSERRFRNESGRVRWNSGNFTASGHFRNRTNENPTTFLAYSGKSRSRGVQVSWADPVSGFVLDAGYNLIGLDISTGILNLFAASDPPSERGRAVYASRIHNVNIALRVAPHERVSLDAGYALTRDAGLAGFSPLGATASRFALDGTTVVSSLPMSYRSPQARVSIAIRKSLSWNFGWQHYGYSERFAGAQSYRAHVGYSSFTFGF